MKYTGLKILPFFKVIWENAKRKNYSMDDQFKKDMELVDFYEQMLEEHREQYFDVEQFERIVEYYMNMGYFKEALRVIDMALRQHPSNTMFPIRRVQNYIELDMADEAGEALNFAEAVNPNNAELLMARGQIAQMQDDDNAAIKYFKAALKYTDEPYEVHTLLAELYDEMGQYELAIRHYKEMLKLEPDDEYTLYSISNCFEMVYDADKQRDFFEKFTNANPYNEHGWFHLSTAYWRMDQTDRAIWALDFALVIDESFTAAYYEKARLLEREERYSEAIATYEASLQNDDPRGYCYFRIGNCYRNIGQIENAKRNFINAIQVDADLDEAHFELSLIYMDSGRLFDASKHIEKCIEIVGDNANYYLIAADIYRKMSNYEKAEETYIKVIDELKFKESDAFIDFAELLLDMDRIDEAFAVLEKGLEIKPNDFDLNAVYIGYLIIVEDFNEAYARLKTALDRKLKIEYLIYHYFPHLETDQQLQEFIRNNQSANLN